MENKEVFAPTCISCDGTPGEERSEEELVRSISSKSDTISETRGVREREEG